MRRCRRSRGSGSLGEGMASAAFLVWPPRGDDTAHLISCRYDHQAMGAVNADGAEIYKYLNFNQIEE